MGAAVGVERLGGRRRRGTAAVEVEKLGGRRRRGTALTSDATQFLHLPNNPFISLPSLFSSHLTAV